MKVTDKFQDTSNHSIEWGNATFNINQISIRNRYDNIQTGKFNKAGSGEIPWNDFKLMIKQSILKKKLTNSELAEILKDIANVI
ncbi:hypothetical protein [Chryseobacterium sp. AG363]|uniref:hypothetical protein n=1 Tax=Chryseobacterium sp. AG363 TaxID=2183997 RepID=UPI000E74B7BC|nr:hypothetical protein [Chryseobacterium sp. AG363]RKE77846.1 hypothetical protein DEU39_3479 [Chryseobacterium sp. AG363]